MIFTSTIKHATRRPVAALMLPALALVMVQESTLAAPVSFAFEAVVGPPNTVSPFDVPFSLSVSFVEGDRIHGMLTVEPVDVGPEVSSIYMRELQHITIDINGTPIGTSLYTVSVRDNLVATHIPVVDELRISCSPLTGAVSVCSPNTIPTDTGVIWGLSFLFQGEPNIIDGADIPGNQNDWNQFTTRMMNMSFREVDGPGIMRLNANVGNFTIIPEVSTMGGSAVVLFCWLLGILRERRPWRITAVSIN